MIENRMRLERQIYLGRQAAKRRSHVSNVPLPSSPPSAAGPSQQSMGRIVTSTAGDSDDDDFDTRTLDTQEGWAAPLPPEDTRPSSSNNTSFFYRLRTQSFPGLAAPIRSTSRLFTREERVERQRETSGSTDSSGEEEQRKPAYHPDVLRSRPDVRRIFKGDGIDGDQEDEGL
jgi:hypothetical protein